MAEVVNAVTFGVKADNRPKFFGGIQEWARACSDVHS